MQRTKAQIRNIRVSFICVSSRYTTDFIRKNGSFGVWCDIELHVSQYSEEDRPMLQRKEHRYKNLLKALSEEQLVYNKSFFFTVEDTRVSQVKLVVLV